MTWLSNRMAEPSTRVGLAALVAILSAVQAHPPQTGQEWLTLIMASLGGVLGIVSKSPGSPDHKPAQDAAQDAAQAG